MVIILKNKLWIILIVFIVIGVGFGIYFLSKNNNSNKSDYFAQKTAVNQQNNTENTTNNVNTNNSIQSNTNTENTENIENPAISPQISNESKPKKEELLSSFSTKIYTKDSARQNNISITCSTLNETIVANGSTFSFCNTVGPATSAKGYQEADIFDNEGNKKKGLGGGNCQVSTTLYNAVLKIPSLVVNERHEHSNKVPYIEAGKDAAVAYGNYDLKFRNDTGFDIKIKVSNSDDSVNVTLYKIY